ncbi:hypothetical protein POM88_046207 [Heracleum sosnowskyi]|uniref:RRM domain-containing protein n=1 Tax=Heracleum sosnowskyi TaxID=360622 RepID=A0AAD8H834_9APIA|nr:hypothetical protein POM88_046207 [Heracleum sosnowskyi]
MKRSGERREAVHTNQGGKFQILNPTRDGKAPKTPKGSQGNRNQLKGDGDKILIDFIMANEDLVDKTVLEEFCRGSKQAVADALNQIHWKSLKKRKVFVWDEKLDSKILPDKTFADVLNKGAVPTPKHDEGCDKTGWNTTKPRKQTKLNKHPDASTIFLYGIPAEATAREIWNIFKRGGVVKDIILPRKRDKRNQRYGFVKTISELEAGTIINNVKAFGGLGAKFRMTINQSQKALQGRFPRQSLHENTRQIPQKELVPRIKGKSNGLAGSKKEEEHKKEVPFAQKMFEYIEAETDPEVEEGLFQTKVGLSRSDETPLSLQGKLTSEGFDYIKVVGLSERKFLLRTEKMEGWKDFDKEPLLTWFYKIRPFEENDLLLSRTTWLECKGLPMIAWIESNLKAFTKSFGEWISWTYQRDNMNAFFNPLICLSTNSWSPINEELTILVKGKQHHICFSEKTDSEDLRSKMLPMEESQNNSISHQKDLESSKGERVTKEGASDLNNDKAIESVPEKSQFVSGEVEKPKASEGGISIAESQTQSNLQDNNEHPLVQRESHISLSSATKASLSTQLEDQSSNGMGTCLSSQATLCNKLGGLKMGGARGRPRKKSKVLKNPFDLGLFRLNQKKSFKSSGAKMAKVYVKKLDKELLKPIEEDNGEDSQKELRNEVEGIVQCALDLGLELIGSEESVANEVARQLQAGSLGLRSRVARRNLKDLVLASKANIICIQETKCESLDYWQKNSIWSVSSHGWVWQKSQGLSGGLLCSWDASMVTCLGIAQTQNWIWMQMSLVSSGERFNVVNIYSPLSKRGKESIWKDLESIVNLSPDEACCFLGDFNCVRNSREKVNCEYRLRDSLGFNSLIKDQNLFDIKFLNTDFTWFDSKGKKSKLDRFLTNLNWYESGEWVVKALGRKQSDHKAIILWVEEQDWGPKPFKVFNWWLQEDSLKKILDEFWASKGSQEKGNIQSLLKEVKLVMKSWGKNIKSDLDNKIQLLESELELQDQSLAASNMAQKIQQELEACYYKRDASLRQKARINWNLQGDRNTKFFHQSILRRRNKNNLRKLLWKGKWITNSRAIKDAFFEYFSSFFSPHPGKGLLKLGSILKKRLDVNEQTFLEKPFSPEELDLAISQSANDKAPGPDGMNMKALKFL